MAYVRGRAKSDRKRKFPFAETAAAAVAFATWGLVMPESPLITDLSGDDREIYTVVITGLGIAALSVLGVPLKEPAKP
jgi:hypothetical protein